MKSAFRSLAHSVRGLGFKPGLVWAGAARRRRPAKTTDMLEWIARVGYGARGFVYGSVGALTLLAAMNLQADAVGTRGAAGWLAEQPLGRVWLVLLGSGLWAFVVWRVLQAVFDADREGVAPRAWLVRAGQAISGLFYGVLAAGVFELLDEVAPRMAAEDVSENQQKAAMILALPLGDMLLIALGFAIGAIGVSNVVRGLGADFGKTLDCSERLCRRFSLMARTGYVARGVAYLPLAVLVILAGWHARSSEVGDFGSSLDALQRQPGGPVLLGATAIGLILFGGFAFVEARYRKIRPPRTLKAP